MRPRQPLLVVLLLLLAPLLAGCVAEQVAPAASVAVDGAGRLPEVLAHRAGEGLAPLPDGVEPLAPVLRQVGARSFEPTLGVTSDGIVFYSVLGDTVTVGRAAKVFRSADGGATWTDVSPTVAGRAHAPPDTNDPYLYVDPATDRVFQFAMWPILGCSWVSWSDDRGESWGTNPRGCQQAPPYDHQTLVAAKPRTVQTSGYANVLVQCVNQIAFIGCARSLDGGATWTPLPPLMVSGDCHALHGHLVSAPDGTIYLPKDRCGTSVVYVSRDDGASWEEVVVSDEPTQDWSDPAAAVDAEGNVYYAFVDAKGAIRLSRSVDGGATWSEAVVASPPGVTGHLPALAAGDAGRVVLAYAGTEDLPKGYDSSDEAQDGASWHGYLTVAADALADDPLFQTARVNPADDPLVRGRCGPARCPGMTDFIDVVVGPDGRPYASFVDACAEACATDEKAGNDASRALLATLAAGPRLLG